MPPRRHLRLVTSSSDEDDQPPPPPRVQQLDAELDDMDVRFQASTINSESLNLSSSNPNPNSSHNVPLDISDDDFIDVSDNLSPTSPSEQPEPPIPAESISTPTESFDCPITGFLADLGLRVRREWLDSCIRGLQRAVPGFLNLDTAAKAKLCFEQFLHSDMNYIGAGVLPANVSDMHLVDLVGPFVLQVDEIVNISRPLKGRYQNASSGHKRCLKLCMTDGIQHVFGMEYRPIKDLEVLAPAGLKVAVCNVNIRHGMLMLVPEVLEVLGGQVEELDAAREKLVKEVNKPARGKRTKSGVVQPLESRATRAAWPPPNGVSAPTHTASSASHSAMPFQADAQGNTPDVSINPRTREESTVPIQRQDHEPNNSSVAPDQRQDYEPNNSSTAPDHRQDYEPNNSSTAPVQRQNYEPNNSSTAPVQRQNYEPNNSYTASLYADDSQMVDEVEHLSLPTRDRETAFKYLSSLSMKCAATKDQNTTVQGKIKCCLTSVKGFQWKERTTYELRVYVDDGSLISEILIDHDVVQQKIGHSPEEVNAAINSSDGNKVSSMKETMKKFREFLTNFEGTMVVQISKASPVPVALEMNQGCSASDAWGLLRRLKRSRPVPQPPYSHSETINISP